MSKTFRRAVCAALVLLFIFAAAGCSLTQGAEPEYSRDTSELSVGSPEKHYFALLNDTEKQAYNAVLSACRGFPSSIEVPALTKDELNRMYTALLYDNPELFFLENASSIRHVQKRTYFYPRYRMSTEDYSAMLGKCNAVAEEILADARKQTTAFARERIVHDRLIAMCTYTDSAINSYKNTVYGVLAGGAASCEGYAKTAKYLLDQLGIPCYVVSGTSSPPGSSTQSHMWNLVQIEDAWYHLDLTWDDPVLEQGGDVIRYSYFNVTDVQIQKTHSEFDAGRECTATAQNFFVHEKLLLTSLDEEEQARAAVFAAGVISLGSDGFQLLFADDESYRGALEYLFAEQNVYTLLKQIRKQTDVPFATDRVSYFNSDEEHSIEIILMQDKQGGEENDGHAEN